MTIDNAINSVDTLKHNTVERDHKIRWLSEVDGMVKREILETHEGEVSKFTGYVLDRPGDTELLVPAPYDALYLRWLEAQIDYHHGEYGKYNNALALFKACYQAYADYYHRNHMPKGGGRFKGV